MKVNIGKYYKNDKPRKIEVKVEKCDTWNLDETLAHVIHPALVQLKMSEHGIPWVDPADAPHVRREHCEYSKHNISHSREAWDYVLDEMIYAMNEIKESLPQEWKFYNIDTNKKVDIEGLKEYNRRITNGCRLFGVYFQSLWG